MFKSEILFVAVALFTQSKAFAEPLNLNDLVPNGPFSISKTGAKLMYDNDKYKSIANSDTQEFTKTDKSMSLKVDKANGVMQSLYYSDKDSGRRFTFDKSSTSLTSATACEVKTALSYGGLVKDGEIACVTATPQICGKIRTLFSSQNMNEILDKASQCDDYVNNIKEFKNIVADETYKNIAKNDRLYIANHQNGATFIHSDKLSVKAGDKDFASKTLIGAEEIDRGPLGSSVSLIMSCAVYFNDTAPVAYNRANRKQGARATK
jgi:hypothetical protein